MTRQEPPRPRILDGGRGRYALLQRVGDGAQGQVYEARCLEPPPGMPPVVAVKTFKPDLYALETDFARAKREYHALAKVRSPHVVRLYDAGDDEHGRPFLVEELLVGCPLDQMLDRRRALPPIESTRVALDVARGLQAIHAAQLVHRDVKFENIYVSAGRAVLLDFGLAKFLDADITALTEPGTLFGTPEYMAPELIDETGIDARTDIYALGVVLFRMLTGEYPYRGRTPLAVMVAVARGRIDWRANLPARLSRIVRRAMARRPADRYPSADALAAALEDELRARGVAVQAPSRPPTPRA